MVHYLIEFRFSGYAKKYLRRTILEVARKYRVRGAVMKRPVPHISLFGPFKTNNIRKVVPLIVDIVSKYDLIPFKLKGFNHIRNDVIYVDIKPSNKLKKLRKELAEILLKHRSLFFIKTVKTIKKYDYDKDFIFHATIAFKDIERNFKAIWNYLKRKEKPNINQHLLRITILKGGRILYEYDLMQKRLLNRRQALSRKIWKRTIEILDKKKNRT